MGFNAIFKPQDSRDTHFEASVMLDGGLGTTLEDVFHKDISHPMWSAKLVDKDGDTVVAAHLAFLRAGSQVILTSTYQMAYETCRRAGYTDSEAEKLMLKSIELALEAREKHENLLLGQQTSPSIGRTNTKIALSLGPYGATLESAAEFTGIYPPPYGPSLILPWSQALDPSREASPTDDTSSTEALASFHFSRLLVYARNTSIWDNIDILAFETIPLLTEAKAIRIAVARLEFWLRSSAPRNGEELFSARMKPWYISFVFPGPNGEFIQCCPASKGVKTHAVETPDTPLQTHRPYTAYEVAQATLTPAGEGSERAMSVPDAIGVNCTPCHFIGPIVEGFASAVRDMQSGRSDYFRDELPWLVLYPNGGKVYDPVGRNWEPGPSTLGDESNASQGAKWVESLAEVVNNHNQGTNPSAGCIDVFGGLVVGGCCKTGPNEIHALKRLVSIP